jgi:mono/diheme cytochrome c family protein
MRTSLIALAGLFIGGAMLVAQAPDPAKIAAGQKVFTAQKCDTCHAIAGKGGKLASALDGVGTKLPEADIRKWLANPAEMERTLPKKPAMPMSSFMKSHKLTDPDVDALTAYMLSLK